MLNIIKSVVEWNPTLAKLYRATRDALDQPVRFRKTPFGFFFCGDSRMEVGEYEKDETELFAKLLPYHDTVINIGANIGFYTCLALQNKKRVIAVEPIERNLRFLLANIEKNNWANECVEIFR